MGVFRTIEENQQNMGVCQPFDQIAKKLLRGLVDPVQVLNHKDNGSILTFSNEQIPDGLERLLPFLDRFQFWIGLIFNFKR